MRYIHALLIILAGFLILPSLTWSQGPGGRGPGGRGPGGLGGGDPDAFFNMVSGGKNVIVVSELDPRWQGMLTRLNLTGDRITKEQFKEAQTKAISMFQSKGANGPPAVTVTPTAGAPAVTIQMGGPQGGPRGPGGPGGPPQSAEDLNRRAEDRFNRLDKNKDGLLDTSELGDPQVEELLREKDSWDANHDGFIDLNEFKAYTSARAAQRAAARAEQDGTNKDPMDPDHPTTTPEDGRPMVFRAGRLPKDLPEWFVRLDKLGDNDGQVGLDEWVKGKQGPLEEYQKMDLNGDGLLTAEEYLRWKALEAKKNGGTQVASRGNNRGGNQGGPQGQGGAPGAFQMPGGGPGGFQMPGGGPGGFQMPGGGGPGGFQRPGGGGPGGFQRPGGGGPGGFQRGGDTAADPTADTGARMRKGGPGGGGGNNSDGTGGPPRGKKNRDNGN